jgi:hypothetical protein
MSLSPSRIAAPAFEIASFARAPMFPAVRFASEMEFRDYLADNQSLLDARAAYERSLAVTKALTRPGTCAPCLRAAEFTSPAAEGTRPPLWRDSQTCDCRDRLSSQHRALLHFVQAAGVFPWTRLLLAGPPSALDLRLSSMVQTAIRLPETGAMAEGEGFHLAVSHNHLARIAKPQAPLAAIHSQLLEGGRFIFTTPFDPGAAPPETPHSFGWDLLAMLREAGFRDAAAYLYWSEELGYLGPMNFIFRAVK